MIHFNNTEVSFLDLDIKIRNNKFVLGLYDKREHFPFSIVRMPYITSNMPSKIFYSSLGAEILRIGRTTNDFSKFKLSSKKITERMIKQGANHHKTQ